MPACCSKTFSLDVSAAAGFTCCHLISEGDRFYGPGFGATRLVAGYISLTPPTTNPFQVFDTSCNGVYQNTTSVPVGQTLWVPEVSRFYFATQNAGGLADGGIGIFNPSDNSTVFIGGWAGSNFTGGAAIWVDDTQRIWMAMRTGTTNNIAVINPFTNTFVTISSALLLGLEDLCYCPSNQCVYCVTSTRLLKVDINTLAVSQVAIVGQDAISYGLLGEITGIVEITQFKGYNITYASSVDRVWIGCRTYQAGDGYYYNVLILDPDTDTLVQALGGPVGATPEPSPLALWYSEDFDRVLVQWAGTDMQVMGVVSPQINTIVVSGRLLTVDAKGVYVASLDDIVIPTRVPFVDYCLTFYPRTTIVPP